jgi:hypothetical protein
MTGFSNVVWSYKTHNLGKALRKVGNAVLTSMANSFSAGERAFSGEMFIFVGHTKSVNTLPLILLYSAMEEEGCSTRGSRTSFLCPCFL